MAAAPLDAQTINAGDTLPLTVTCRRSDKVTPIDLTGATVRFALSSSPAVVKTIGAGVTITAPATAGVCSVLLSPADTSALPAGTYTYDVVVVEASGTRSSAVGAFTIIDHPSRT